MVVFVQILNTVYTVEENEWQMPRGKAGFACPLCHVCEMFICLEFFECHKIRSVHADNLGDSFLGRCHAELVHFALHTKILYAERAIGKTSIIPSSKVS